MCNTSTPEGCSIAAGPPQRKLVQRNGSQDDADTPVRKTVGFTTIQQTHYCETSEDEEGTEEATPSPGDDAEEFRTVEVRLSEITDVFHALE